jgi:hypothetical protein
MRYAAWATFLFGLSGSGVIALFSQTAVAAAPEREGRSALVSIEVVGMASEGGRHRVERVVAAKEDGITEGMLGTTYRVTISRSGGTARARITRLDNRPYYRSALECRFTAGTRELALGYYDVPVVFPVERVQRIGQFYNTWNWDLLPSWITVATAAGESACVAPTANAHHGMFLIKQSNGEYEAQFGLDVWEVGQSAEMTVRLASGPQAAALAERANREARDARLKAARLAANAAAAREPTVPLSGFVRVDPSGRGFVSGDGRPMFVAGRNIGDLPAFCPEEQELLLEQMAASGMNTTRICLWDCLYRPLPGLWNEAALARLKPTLDRCAKHGIRVVVCLELSANGYQYSCTTHRTRAWSDIYFLEEAKQWYRDAVRRIVVPLKDHPAVFAWNVTNEPAVEPDAESPIQAGLFRQWLQGKYGTIDALRRAWKRPDLRGLEAVVLPDAKGFNEQSDPAARDFFELSSAALARSLIERARIVRQVDGNHLLTVSHWNPRLFRGHRGAEVFDFWAPHTYDLWINGPEIDRHMLFLVESLRRAVPDRDRPVLIEEFGISTEPKYPESLRVEHVGQFIDAARRRGGAGILHWWEMTPAMFKQYARPAPSPTQASPHPASTVAVHVPPSEEAFLVIYQHYGTRRIWDQAVAAAVEKGYRVRFVSDRESARPCAAVLLLFGLSPPSDVASWSSLSVPVYTASSTGGNWREMPPVAK